jgi:hypothetical protein
MLVVVVLVVVSFFLFIHLNHTHILHTRIYMTHLATQYIFNPTNRTPRFVFVIYVYIIFLDLDLSISLSMLLQGAHPQHMASSENKEGRVSYLVAVGGREV